MYAINCCSNSAFKLFLCMVGAAPALPTFSSPRSTCQIFMFMLNVVDSIAGSAPKSEGCRFTALLLM